MKTTPCMVLFLFYFGFFLLCVFTYYKLDWICNRFGDIEKVVTEIVTDFIYISIQIIFVKSFESIFESLRPTVTNLIYSFKKLSSYLLKKINNEIPYLYIWFERNVIDLLITILDDFFFYPVIKIYVDFIKPEALILMSIFIPMFVWIKRWIESKVSFIRCLKECNKKIWQL